jgi:hypothetical protein
MYEINWNSQAYIMYGSHVNRVKQLDFRYAIYLSIVIFVHDRRPLDV